MANTELTRRAASFQAMRAYARQQGFPMPSVAEQDCGDHVKLIALDPGGQNFALGYVKDRADA